MMNSVIYRYCGVDDELPKEYIEENNFRARYSINMLKFLYDNQHKYTNLLEFIKQAQPGQYFKQYVDEYSIAQKYGYFEGYLNDVAIVYTPEPFLLTVYTYGVSEDVLGAVCRVMCDYTLAADEDYDTDVASTATCAESTPESVLRETTQAAGANICPEIRKYKLYFRRRVFLHSD